MPETAKGTVEMESELNTPEAVREPSDRIRNKKKIQVSYFISILYFGAVCLIISAFLLFPFFAAVSLLVFAGFYKTVKISEQLTLRKKKETGFTRQSKRREEYAEMIALYLGISRGEITYSRIVALSKERFLRPFLVRRGGKEIPLGVQIFSLANAWDFLTWKSSLKAEPNKNLAIKILQNEAGKRWDSSVVAAFFAAYEDGNIRRVEKKYQAWIWKRKKIALERLEKVLS